ncbi:MAG: endonuclease/exonuclease/phosphatase family protein [Bdellovibrionales bacterium]|nr:endonuclease/exonuclease/phosphatase family protein [Bdellovibrionales bacterium]
MSAFFLILIWILPNYKKFLFTINLLTLLITTYNVLPYWGYRSSDKSIELTQTKYIDVFYANINSNNINKSKVIKYLLEYKPDLVFLVEVNAKWFNEIRKLNTLYPYTKAIIRESNFGMAVLSKTHLVVENVIIDRKNMIPALQLKNNSKIGNLDLFLLHPHPPIGNYGTLLRDRYLETLSHRISEVNGPILTCGDFNTTPWSSIFQKFLNYSKLDYKLENGVPNTWPSSKFIPGLPLDHCLSKNLKVIEYKTGPLIGSDHRPLYVKLSSEYKTVKNEK